MKRAQARLHPRWTSNGRTRTALRAALAVFRAAWELGAAGVLCEALPARGPSARRGVLAGDAGTVCSGEEDSEF